MALEVQWEVPVDLWEDLEDQDQWEDQEDQDLWEDQEDQDLWEDPEDKCQYLHQEP